jgi:hypothetical protein
MLVEHGVVLDDQHAGLHAAPRASTGAGAPEGAGAGVASASIKLHLEAAAHAGFAARREAAPALLHQGLADGQTQAGAAVAVGAAAVEGQEDQGQGSGLMPTPVSLTCMLDEAALPALA